MKPWNLGCKYSLRNSEVHPGPCALWPSYNLHLKYPNQLSFPLWTCSFNRIGHGLISLIFMVSLILSWSILNLNLVSMISLYSASSRVGRLVPLLSSKTSDIRVIKYMNRCPCCHQKDLNRCLLFPSEGHHERSKTWFFFFRCYKGGCLELLLCLNLPLTLILRTSRLLLEL